MIICLAVAVGISGALLLVLGSHLTFVNDDWEYLLNRRGSSLDVFLDPFYEHIPLAKVAIYKSLLSTFGMSSALPFRVVAISVFLLSAILLFVYLRGRIGDWAALLAGVLILFLGDAFEVLLWPVSVDYFGSVAAGLGMLIALDRDDRSGDRLACVLLTVSLAFHSIGCAFAVGALVDLALSRRPRLGRAYVAVLPLALFALWWLGWGHSGESNLSADNLASTPEYVFDVAAAGITSLLGLATGDGTEPDQPHLIWGKIALIAGVVLVGLRLWRADRFPRDLAIALSIALTFWVGIALNETAELGRVPTASRYQYPSAVFLLLIAGSVLRGVRISGRAIATAAVVTGVAIAGGVSLLYEEYTERWRPSTDSLRGSLAAVEISRDSLDPAFRLIFGPTLALPPHAYLSAVDDYGSPAYSESELSARPEPDRATADRTLASALGLRLAPESSARTKVECQTVQASPAVFTGLTLLRGGFTLTNQGDADAEVLLGRFSDGLSVDLGPLAAGTSTSLTIPVDRSTRPWRLGLAGEGPVELCSTAPAPNP